MKKHLWLAGLALFFGIFPLSAKIWRVNNNVGVSADFTDIQSAVTAAVSGDTIMVEGSATAYNGFSLNKRLTFIGTGYYLNDATPNPKTQAIKDSSNISYAQFDPGSKGSRIAGFTMSYIYLSDSLITIERNNLGAIYLDVYGDCYGDTIRQNVITGGLYNSGTTHKNVNLLVYNNIISGGIQVSSSLANFNGFFINNIFIGSAAFYCANFTFQNNIFYAPFFGAYLGSNIFFNNITTGTEIPAGNGNQQNVNLDNVFLGFSSKGIYSADGRYKLAPGSPAINAGVINSVTVDCGAFGGPAPYVLSGMPPVPSIYSLSVPSSVPSGTTTINISLSSTTVH